MAVLEGNMNIKHTSILLATILAAGCRPPEQPASLNSGSSGNASSSTNTSGTAAASPSGFYAGGAEVGDQATKDAVKKCLDTKVFFDRQTGTCTNNKLAGLECKDDKLSAFMSLAQLESLKGFRAAGGKLEGFLLDQCLDCSDPSANQYCKGSSATAPTEKGVRLFFVKAVTGTT